MGVCPYLSRKASHAPFTLWISIVQGASPSNTLCQHDGLSLPGRLLPVQAPEQCQENAGEPSQCQPHRRYIMGRPQSGQGISLPSIHGPTLVGLGGPGLILSVDSARIRRLTALALKLNLLFVSHIPPRTEPPR